ncbi:L,D-transpeptidase family protein [Oceanobacillus chungangensis]|uniref:L,D-transpeptidase family protein n=1 Tax=Oceanobacillus chungangensis TaxID=1229152 RepID=UPI001FE3A578|nr:L,D-transpeptidase family protein [Oceanobacillus chungangensis]
MSEVGSTSRDAYNAENLADNRYQIKTTTHFEIKHAYLCKTIKFAFVFKVLFLFLVSLSLTQNVEAKNQDVITIYINLWENQLSVMEDGVVIAQYPIGPGTDRTPTPIGRFKIIDKSRNWGHGFGTRWLGLDVPWGNYGIHGTNKPVLIGKNVSSGCVRMHNEDVEELFTRINVGTTVYIDGPITGLGEWEFRNLAIGSKGNLVQLVQNRLKAAGFYYGVVDGIYRETTEDAVKRFQRSHGLPVTGQIGERMYIELGILE